MSWQATEMVIAHSQAKGTERLVLLVLASYADAQTGEAWPSVATIAQGAALGERQTQALLRRLEASGEIVSDLGGGRKHTTVYTLTCVKRVQDSAPFPVKTVQGAAPIRPAETVQDRVKRVQDPAETVQDCAETVQSSAPEPLKNRRTLKEPPTARNTAAPGQTADARSHVPAVRPPDGGAAVAAAPGQPDPLQVSAQAATRRTEPGTSTNKVPAARRGPAPLPDLPNDLAALPGMPQAWAEWLTYRRERRLATAPSTALGMFNKLRRLRDEGHPPVEVIRTSIDNGWQGLFPVRAPHIVKFTPPEPVTDSGEIDMAALIAGAPLNGTRRKA